MRVLIVEDEPAIAMVLTELLADEGYDVISELDGLSGLNRIREEPRPDVVLIDLFMPRLSGREVLERMRSDPEIAAIPVMLITGAVPDENDFPPKGSYQAMLSKPFDLQDVLNHVRELTGS